MDGDIVDGFVGFILGCVLVGIVLSIILYNNSLDYYSEIRGCKKHAIESGMAAYDDTGTFYWKAQQ